MRSLKRQSRVLGIDDGPYVRGSDTTPIVMTVWRLDGYIDGFLMARVKTDGDDSAEVISRSLMGSRFGSQVRCIISDGACLAGFNVLDMDELNRTTCVPVITTSDEIPDTPSIAKALKSAGLDDGRLERITRHEPFVIESIDGPVHIRICGASKEDAISVVMRTIVYGRVPEPVRISHLIAKAIYQ